MQASVAPGNPAASGNGWRVLLILGLSLWIYWPALHGGWVWDDRIDLLENSRMADAAGWWKIWLQPAGWNFFPLTSTVQWALWQVWGAAPFGYHVVNLALHGTSALLLWRVLSKLGLREAWLGGLLFAVHPLAVESVAWIAELKNTLSLALLLVSVLAWLDFSERRGAGNYVRALGFFVLALLAKTSVVAFPAALAWCDFWRRKRIEWAALLPFFGASLALGLLTIRFEHRPAAVLLDLPNLDWWSRLAGAGGALAWYLGKAILPVGLSPAYPEWSLAEPSPGLFLPWVLLGLALFVGWRWRGRGGGPWLVLLGCYVASLLPVLGLVPMAYHHIAWVADHFAYLALAVLAGGAALLAGHLREGRQVAVGGVAVAMALAIASRQPAAAFRDEQSLWVYASERQPTAWLPKHNLARVLQEFGRTDEAIAAYEAALRLKPSNADGWNNLGNLLLAQGRTADAIARYEEAVRLQPRYPQAWANLGNALWRAGRRAEAAHAAQQALAIDPGHAPAWRVCADVAVSEQRYDDAADCFARMVSLAPTDADAKSRLVAALMTAGNEHLRAGRAAEAKQRYQAALHWRPDDPEAHNNLAFALVRLEQYEDAIRECERALALRPDYAEARENLARLRAWLANR